MGFIALNVTGWVGIPAEPIDRVLTAVSGTVVLRRQTDDPEEGARHVISAGQSVTLPGNIAWSVRLNDPRPGAGVRVTPSLNLKETRAGPGWDMFPITPNDDADLAVAADAIYVAVGGNLTVITASGMERTWPVADYSILPVGVVRVKATGTTVEDIFGIV